MELSPRDLHGQIAAALVTGNAVLAKPAEQTPLIAARAAELLWEAGVPREVFHLLPGDGTVGAALTADPRLEGVCFTGSTEVAQIINRQLATTAPRARLIAETGGLNAMIVDSTALPEQAVRDILASAFQSAGQRCSALRILYIQRDIEERFLEMLTGAMDLLRVGDPRDEATDIGPLIDADALDAIGTYCKEMEQAGQLLHRVEAPANGHFLAPHLLRVRSIQQMEREIFGPVLHVARFDADCLDQVIADVNASGYGLTFGLHTRVDARVQRIVDQIGAGNVYVNRNQIGAIVGSQPFGGMGLSGTGPKAGGPYYLGAFVGSVDAGPVAEVSPAAVSPREISAAFDALDGASWAMRKDRISKLRTVLRGRAAQAMSAAAVLDPGPIDLPGPTGESNRLQLVPRGRVLCTGTDPDDLLDRVAQSLAAGNATLVVAPGGQELVRELVAEGMPVTALSGILDPASLSQTSFDCLAGPFDQNIRCALADRDGPIVPHVCTRIAPEAYVHERAICIDTTAAGGNATLLAEVG